MADPESEFQIGGIGVMLEVDYDARLCMRVMGRIAAFESIAYGPSAQCRGPDSIRPSTFLHF